MPVVRSDSLGFRRAARVDAGAHLKPMRTASERRRASRRTRYAPGARGLRYGPCCWGTLATLGLERLDDPETRLQDDWLLVWPPVPSRPSSSDRGGLRRAAARLHALLALAASWRARRSSSTTSSASPSQTASKPSHHRSPGPAASSGRRCGPAGRTLPPRTVEIARRPPPRPRWINSRHGAAAWIELGLDHAADGARRIRLTPPPREEQMSRAVVEALPCRADTFAKIVSPPPSWVASLLSELTLPWSTSRRQVDLLTATIVGTSAALA